MTTKVQKVLVTGGGGFIGSHLVDALCDSGYDVTVLDLLTTGKARNLHQSIDRIRLVRGSILDVDLVDRLVEEADLVFHLAAAVGVRHIVEDPLDSILVNVRGTDHVLSACFKYWKRVLVASTSEVYGRTAKVPMQEDDDRVLGATTVHRWSYSTSKALDEHLALAYGANGLPVTIVRYFNAYGPRLDPRGYGSVMASFLRDAVAGVPITVHGDGQQSRCFTYVADTVRGTIAAGFSESSIGKVINIGNTRETTILELAEMIRDYVGSSSSVTFASYESYYGPGFADTRRRVPDASRAKELLGWEPTVGLEEGLGLTYEWWKRHVS